MSVVLHSRCLCVYAHIDASVCAPLQPWWLRIDLTYRPTVIKVLKLKCIADKVEVIVMGPCYHFASQC